MICYKNRKNKPFYDSKNWPMKDFNNWKLKKRNKLLLRSSKRRKRINIGVTSKLKCR